MSGWLLLIEVCVVCMKPCHFHCCCWSSVGTRLQGARRRFQKLSFIYSEVSSRSVMQVLLYSQRSIDCTRKKLTAKWVKNNKNTYSLFSCENCVGAYKKRLDQYIDSVQNRQCPETRADNRSHNDDPWPTWPITNFALCWITFPGISAATNK